MRREGGIIHRKTVQRHMREMGIAAIYPGPNLSRRKHKEHVFPYLLRNLTICAPHHVWGIDVRHVGALGIPAKAGKDESKIPLGCWLT